ncbi:hypothetical protein PanWU01x14_333680 [Parasponia andersonii]|uniref:Uncharacterized protein n=1 Tax=Parasponia andersonii TaxID=3476 RepID=A0A2P5AGU2_PARAD|nr:hypothetical protein PanWU01x14_333680 [Parasponia andersonii]
MTRLMRPGFGSSALRATLPLPLPEVDLFLYSVKCPTPENLNMIYICLAPSGFGWSSTMLTFFWSLYYHHPCSRDVNDEGDTDGLKQRE